MYYRSRETGTLKFANFSKFLLNLVFFGAKKIIFLTLFYQCHEVQYVTKKQSQNGLDKSKRFKVIST